MPQGYKDTEFNKDTGRRTEIRDADYRIRGSIEVAGTLTNNGSPVGGGGSVTLEVPTGAVDGNNKIFVFTVAPFAVFYQGNLQALNDDYTQSTVTVTFDAAPVSGIVQGFVSS